MKYLFLVSCTVLFSFNCFSQQLEEKLKGKTNLVEIQSIANSYFTEKGLVEKNNLKEEDNEFIKYKRKENFWQHRVMLDGSLPNLNEQYQTYLELQKNSFHKKTRGTVWKNISQTTSTGGYSAMGRVIAIAFHPTDTNTFYVGAPIGGIWKTTTGGNNWTPLGDQLPYCSVGNIVVDFQNPNTLYITVGQNEGWWEYGLGIYKSTDGGQTWNATSQTTNFTNAVVYYKLIMSPLNNNILFSAQSNGLFKSVDAGATWTKVYNNTVNDIEFKPFHATTLYATTKVNNSQVIHSIDDGTTWNTLSTFATNAFTGLELSVTIADSNYIGVGAEGASKSFYLSTNGGGSFIEKNTNIDDNIIVQFSAINKNKVYCGYVSNHRSNDAGATWTKFTNWYNDGVLPTVHADNHFTAINPLKPNSIYFCNDGGVYEFKENLNTWKDLSNGLIITQFYKIANSQQDSVFMIGGTQDNGGRKRKAIGTWGATNGGDAMEVAINKDDDQIIYTTYVYGQLYRSTDQWTNDVYHDISPDTIGGSWVAPYLIDPNNSYRIVVGYNNVYLSNDGGDTWQQISNNLTGSINNKLTVLDIAPSNSDVIYAGYGNKIYYTSNLGTSWTTKIITSSSSMFEELSCLTVHPKNANKIYATKSGYNANNKVFVSNNNGTNWINIKYNLPNVPINNLIFDKESDSTNFDMYLATDVGVFTKQENDTVWNYFGTELPNTSCRDLEIFYAGKKLRVGTHGRGIFETDLARHENPVATPALYIKNYHINLYENPVNSEVVMNIDLPQNESFNFTIIDASGKKIKTTHEKFVAGKNKYSIPFNSFAQGNYFIEISNEKNSWHKTLQFVK